jgi:hypothetical protein
MDFWKNSSTSRKGAIIAAIIVVGFILVKWMGWI